MTDKEDQLRIIKEATFERFPGECCKKQRICFSSYDNGQDNYWAICRNCGSYVKIETGELDEEDKESWFE